jgi:hypothetical protein
MDPIQNVHPSQRPFSGSFRDPLPISAIRVVSDFPTTPKNQSQFF